MFLRVAHGMGAPRTIALGASTMNGPYQTGRMPKINRLSILSVRGVARHKIELQITGSKVHKAQTMKTVSRC